MDQLLIFLGVVVVQIGGAVTAYLTSRKGQKSGLQKIVTAQQEDNKKIRNDLQDVKGDLQDVKNRLDVFEERQNKIEEKEFAEKEINDAITTKAFSIISANTESLDNNIRAILNVTEQKITKFAIGIRNSPYRKKGRQKWEEYLNLKVSSIKEQIRYLVNDIYPQKHEIKGVVMDYNKFIYHSTTITTDIAVLVQFLVKNGMKNGEYTLLFVDFIEKIFKQQIKGWRKWEQL